MCLSKVDFEVGTMYRPQNRFVAVTNENSVGTFPDVFEIYDYYKSNGFRTQIDL